MERIGMLGSGDVAKSLAKGFVKHGYSVMMGSRDSSKIADFSREMKLATGTFQQAASFGDMVVLAVKGLAGESALSLAGEQSLNGKIVIDATNPISDAPPDSGVLHYFTSLEESLMERYQGKFPSARFVKAFNSVGNAYFVNPDFGGEKPTMFICGNDEAAKKEVGGVLGKFGWEVADMGGVQAARAIEPLCMLWCIPGIAKNDWGPRAFKLLKK